jgi:hypothetical protein
MVLEQTRLDLHAAQPFRDVDIRLRLLLTFCADRGLVRHRSELSTSMLDSYTVGSRDDEKLIIMRSLGD